MTNAGIGPSTTVRRLRAAAGPPGVIAMVVLFAVGLSVAGCGFGPSANAGDDLTVEVGQPIEFDGCGSGGDGLSYTWTVIDVPAEPDESGEGDQTDSTAEPGPAADIGRVLRQSIGTCSFTLSDDHIVTTPGVWTIQLAVTDGVNVATDEVNVNVVES